MMDDITILLHVMWGVTTSNNEVSEVLFFWHAINTENLIFSISVLLKAQSGGGIFIEVAKKSWGSSSLYISRR